MQISYRETVERYSKQAPPGYDVYELLWQDGNRSTSTIHANTQQGVEGHSSLGHSLPDLTWPPVLMGSPGSGQRLSYNGSLSSR